MNPAYRVWWRVLMDLRPLVRFLGERFPRTAPWGLRLRSLAHLVVGNPLQTLAVVDGLWLWRAYDVPFRAVAAGIALVIVFVEVYHRLAYRTGGWLVGWREAWRIHRRWPADWAVVAAKTTRVQAEVGTSKEPIASAVLRPVADHPKMGWWPTIEWPVVTWWVGPPPGRSLAALDELAVVLAANISHVSDVYVEYERENDSYGRLTMTFDDVLAEPTTPDWTTHGDGPDTGHTNGDDGDGLDAALADLDRTIELPRHLRVIDGEAQS